MLMAHRNVNNSKMFYNLLFVNVIINSFITHSTEATQNITNYNGCLKKKKGRKHGESLVRLVLHYLV